MGQLLIQIDTPEDEALLRQILPKFNSHVIEPTNTSIGSPKKTLAEVLEEAAAKGGFSSFGDASEWQREIRSWDRVLEGREE